MCLVPSMASDTGWFTLVKDGATEQAIDLGALSLLAPEHAPEWVAVRLLTPARCADAALGVFGQLWGAVVMQQDGVMAKEMFKNLRQKLMGDERNQRQALQDAGFAGEADAVAWAQSIIGQSVEESTQFMNLRKLRQAKPELTLKTATFILDRTKLLGRPRQP